MHQVIHTQSRDELISLGNAIRLALRNSNRDEPWIICLGADADSGKELIALAIDQALNPQRYAGEIGKHIFAESYLGAGNEGDPQTVFHNFRRIIMAKKDAFDKQLDTLKTNNPQASVLIAANVERTFVGNFDYKTDGLSSDLLDINLYVHKLEGFERRIEITANDEAFQHNLASKFAAPAADLVDGNKPIQSIRHKKPGIKPV